MLNTFTGNSSAISFFFLGLDLLSMIFIFHVKVFGIED